MSHPIPAVLVMLGVLVFVHEAGHFLVGRLSGIAVETFSIGFGPRIFGFRHRGTDYRISWLPLGGYVKFAGAHPAEDVPEGLPGIPFRDASLPRRAATIVAGPLANFLLAIVAYAVLGMDGIPHPPALIGEVLPASAAERAGLEAGDRVVAVDGVTIEHFRDLEKIISGSPGKPLKFTVEREGQPAELTVTPAEVMAPDFLGKKRPIGRAGIAVGRLPAIVAITDRHAPAAMAGLATGDRVRAVSWTSGSGQLETHETASFSDLTKLLGLAAQDPAVMAVSLSVDNPAAPPLFMDEAESKLVQEQAAPQQDGGGKLTRRTIPLDFAAVRDGVSAPRGRALMALLGIHDAQLAVSSVAAPAVGILKPGDVIVGWDGKPVPDMFAMQEARIANTQPTAELKVVRDFADVALSVPLKSYEAQKPEGMTTLYALPALFWGRHEEPEPVYERYRNPFAAVSYGLGETVTQSKLLLSNIAFLMSGEIPLKSLGGPMLIAKVAGDSARRGWQTFVGAMALISINLGLLNLFPIPVLDGGQLVLMGAEAVRRRPLRESAIESFQKVGFAMILALVVLATYNDLSRFWKSMLASVAGIFS